MPAAAAAAPKYSVLIVQAIAALKERNGSSLPAIVKYVCLRNMHQEFEITRLFRYVAANNKLTGNYKQVRSSAFKHLKPTCRLPSPLFHPNSLVASSSLPPSRKASPRALSLR
jgi:hypothetical protein